MPADAWSQKDERQYRKILTNCLHRDGRKTRACRVLAAATVNKQRCRDSRAKVCATSSFLPRKVRSK